MQRDGDTETVRMNVPGVAPALSAKRQRLRMSAQKSAS